MTESLLEAIRAGVTDGASADARAAGATACRTLLAVLDASVGKPLAIAAPAAPTSPVAALVGAMRGMPAEQLLDLLIAKLRSIVPADAPAVQTYKLAIPVSRVPR
jgi:hypothetical protein